MANTLVSPVELDVFPGGPFDAAVVDAAAAEIRGVAGWHIAPEQTETVTVDGTGGAVLVLPTLLIVSVSEVRDVTGDTPEVLDDWEIRKGGMLYRRQGWPRRLQSVEVDLTHGHPAVPEDLLPVIAQAANGTTRDPDVSQLSVGSFSESYRHRAGGTSAALARYTIVGV